MEALPLDLLCVADLCVDLIVTGDVVARFGQAEQWLDDYLVELGGSATILASQFVKLGGSAGVIGKVGADAFGEFVLRRMEEIGIDAARVGRQAGLKTGLGLALTKPDDRAILTYPGSIDAVQPGDLSDECLAGCRHWHIASYFLLRQLRPTWPEWLRRCRGAGITTSLDTNWDPEERWAGVLELLPLIDVLLPNETEACAIAGATDAMQAGRTLAGRGPLVVVKRGEKGAVAFNGGRRWEMPPPDGPAQRVVDSIGAGDSFDAGFLYGWLMGREVEKCLELACRCGKAGLSAAGGITGQLDQRQAAEGYGGS